MKLEQLSSNLSTIDRSFYPFPFWFWNGGMDKKEIILQLDEMKLKKINTFIIHARKGLELEYLGEDWFDAVETTLCEAQKREMQVYIYDEDNWPSGYAAGKVVQENEKYCGKHLRRLARELDISNDLVAKDETSLYVQEFTSWQPAYSELLYTDMLSSDATDCFIKYTHNEYYSRFRKYFSNTIIGFFVDEPGFYSNFEMYEARIDRGTIPWTENLPHSFLEEKGYDILENLAHIWDNIDETSAKVRCDYYDVLGKMYFENFLRRLKKWCDEKSIRLIGHLHSEEFLPYHVKTQGDLLKGISELEYAGVDKIELFSKKISEKYASSAQHIYDMKRTMSETYANSGWYFTLRDAKRWANYQLIRGINMFCLHAFYYSIEGERKDECPPSLFIQNPYWVHFGKFSSYIAKTSKLLTLGTHLCEIGVYYPIETQKYLVRPTDIVEAEALDHRFIEISTALLDAQLDFNYVNEDALNRAKFEKGILAFGDEEIRLLIVACVKCLNINEMRKLHQYASNGGKILFIYTDVIFCTDTKKTQEFTLLYDEIRKLSTTTYFNGYGIQSNLTYDVSEVNLKRVIDNIFTPLVHVHCTNQNIKYIARNIENLNLFMFSNESETDIDEAITLNMEGKLYEFDIENETFSEQYFKSDNHGQMTFTLELTHFGQKIFVVDTQKKDDKNSYEQSNDNVIKYHHIQFLYENFYFDFGDGIIKTSLKGWDDLGYAHFSGSVSYKTEFEIDEQDSKKTLLELSNFKDCATIYLNGKKVTELIWEPYQADISGHVINGKNVLELKVTNTLANQLEQKYYPSGLIKPIKIISIY